LALFEGYPAGDYDYEASKTGYSTITGTVTVIEENLMEFVVLSPALNLDITAVFEGPFNGSTTNTTLYS